MPAESVGKLAEHGEIKSVSVEEPPKTRSKVRQTRKL